MLMMTMMVMMMVVMMMVMMMMMVVVMMVMVVVMMVMVVVMMMMLMKEVQFQLVSPTSRSAPGCWHPWRSCPKPWRSHASRRRVPAGRSAWHGSVGCAMDAMLWSGRRRPRLG